MQTVVHENVALSTLDLGPKGKDSTVFLHGLVSGNLATWYSSFALPLAEDRHAILYDLRGHGDSSVPINGFDLNSHARDLKAIIDHKTDPNLPVDLVGHSMGALIALRFALTWPERLKRLVLVDAPMPACAWVAPSLQAAKSPDHLTDWLETDPMLSGQTLGRRKARLKQRLESLLFNTSLVSDVLAMKGETDESLEACHVPTLLVYGRHSPCLEAGLHLAEKLPDCRFKMLDCGHYIPLEEPKGLLGVLSEFLTVDKTDKSTA